MKSIFAFMVMLLPLVAPAISFAEVRDVELRIVDGKVSARQLIKVLPGKVDIAWLGLRDKQINAHGITRSKFAQAVEAAVGDGCKMRIEGDVLKVHVNTHRWPKNMKQVRLATRLFAAAVAPDDRRQDHRWGMKLPQLAKDDARLVVLIPGLDSDFKGLEPMGHDLTQRGHKVAYFGYPSDAPISESVTRFTETMSELRKNHPRMNIDIVGVSMGGLIARGYIEGQEYYGNVRRLIMLGTPNQGTCMSMLRPLLEIVEHRALAKGDSKWHWSWTFSDGMGEAGEDLAPGSAFLKQLNSQPRRKDVAYSIIAGKANPVYTKPAEWIEGSRKLIPESARHWWGLRHLDSGLSGAGASMASASKGDGVVGLKDCRLDGVTDFVTLDADHQGLFVYRDNRPPASLEHILKRLKAE